MNAFEDKVIYPYWCWGHFYDGGELVIYLGNLCVASYGADTPPTRIYKD